MVFVFGMDVPLVELIFVLTVILFLVLALMVYLIINQLRLNKKLELVSQKEQRELRDLETIDKEEKAEVKLLRSIKVELNKMLSSETYTKKIEMMVAGKAKTHGKSKHRKFTERDKIRVIAEAIWDELVKVNEKEAARREQIKRELARHKKR